MRGYKDRKNELKGICDYLFNKINNIQKQPISRGVT